MAFRILLTSTGGSLSVETIHRLKTSTRHEIEVIAVDMSTDTLARDVADYFYTVPSGRNPAYVSTIEAIAAKHAIDLILPCSDEEALALAEARDTSGLFSENLACASASTLRMMSDKVATYAALACCGLKLPEYAVAYTRDQLEELTAAFNARFGEFAVKPKTARGGRAVFVVSKDVSGSVPSANGREVSCDEASWHREHLAEAARHLPVIVMERLFEPVYDIDSLSRSGELLRTFQRRRLNPAGVPFCGNVSADDTRLEEIAERVTSTLNLSWLYDFDVMSAHDGSPRLIEVNPRPSGSVAAAVACGVPLLDDLVSLAKGEALPPIEKNSGVMVRPFNSIIVCRDQSMSIREQRTE